ncbi:MAG: YabP/YqfC family sporulation protein [Oscillospiraceae bacterium]|nr:YabP/YqfC family sporulation protein [Oscillospiraceae bacterium]
MRHMDTARDIAESLGLAPELFSGALRVTVWGRRQVMVEQHRGLLGYSGELIEVGGGKTRLRIVGSGMLLQAMDRDTLVITGNITAVEYE